MSIILKCVILKKYFFNIECTILNALSSSLVNEYD